MEWIFAQCSAVIQFDMSRRKLYRYIPLLSTRAGEGSTFNWQSSTIEWNYNKLFVEPFRSFKKKNMAMTETVPTYQ